MEHENGICEIFTTCAIASAADKKSFAFDSHAGFCRSKSHDSLPPSTCNPAIFRLVCDNNMHRSVKECQIVFFSLHQASNGNGVKWKTSECFTHFSNSPHSSQEMCDEFLHISTIDSFCIQLTFMHDPLRICSKSLFGLYDMDGGGVSLESIWQI